MGSGYFASRGKIAPCYFVIWRQNNPNAASAKIALTKTLTLTQTEEKHYFENFTVIPNILDSGLDLSTFE